jgi:hypothetical protein
MITGMLSLGAILAWFLLMVLAFDSRSIVVSWLCRVACFLSLAWFIGRTIERYQEFPCVKYDTNMQYNSATKTVMPMRHCVERGEWVQHE